MSEFIPSVASVTKSCNVMWTNLEMWERGKEGKEKDPRIVVQCLLIQQSKMSSDLV